ncbi:hypothetical protein OPAG_08137 [Rhodococcus opacus PD630]|nr:hypothetical protein OPAG_08137 [Rhodococcus opacus PD630]
MRSHPSPPKHLSTMDALIEIDKLPTSKTSEQKDWKMYALSATDPRTQERLEMSSPGLILAPRIYSHYR